MRIYKNDTYLMEDVGVGTYNLYLRGKYVSAIHIRLSSEMLRWQFLHKKHLKVDWTSGNLKAHGTGLRGD